MKELSVGKVLLFLVGVVFIVVGAVWIFMSEHDFAVIREYYPNEVGIGYGWQIAEAFVVFGVLFILIGLFALVGFVCWVFL